MRRRLCALLLLLAALTWAQGVHPITGRRYAGTMSADGAAWLSRPEREAEEQPDKALQLIGVAQGSTVADIGAGSGYMTLRMAKLVGPTGKVYAEDIQSRMLELLQQNAKRQKAGNVQTVLGAFDDPRLPAATMDLVLMVDVYHEFSEPQKMLRHIGEALKPDGRMVLVEYRGEDPAVPIRPEHKMTVEQVKAEVEPEGFRLERVMEELPRQHVVIFGK